MQLTDAEFAGQKSNTLLVSKPLALASSQIARHYDHQRMEAKRDRPLLGLPHRISNKKGGSERMNTHAAAFC
jgi:hypothetical protein